MGSLGGAPVRARFDILGLGCVAVDDLVAVRAYPRADAKIEVRRRDRQCGGLAATALVAAARLGARCAYAGLLGDDPDSAFVRAAFEREGIDTSRGPRHREARPVRSFIVVDERAQTRTVFFATNRYTGAHARLPAAQVVTACRVLLVDRFGIPGMIRAARLARRAGIPVVGDFESSRWARFEELLAWVDHLIVSEDFAREFTGCREPAVAARRLWGPKRAVVIVTCGARGGWVMDRRAERPWRFPAFRVKAVDTTGCGDVFHGAYAVGLARWMTIEDCVRQAAACAALKATRPGGQAGCPDLGQVRRLLARSGAAGR
ncbi:MAG: permease [Verrucomicrobia bacterium]|nr:permease [Verrucomicrobiota bacterium]